MQEKLYLNGSFFPSDEAKISVMDRGFLFGDGVYELIPVYKSKPFLLGQHLDRLRVSLDLTGINKELINFSKINDAVNELISVNQYKEHSIYIQITRGVEKIRQHIFDKCGEPTVLVMGQPYKKYSVSELEQGFKACIQDDYRWTKANIKSTSLLANVMLKNSATKMNKYEAILIRDNKLTEGSASNVFVLSQDVIKTPKLSNKLLSGVTRNLLIELLRQNTIEVSECDISKEEVLSAQEIWCSSSTNPVVPIVTIDDISIGSGKVGKFTLDAYKIMDDYINQY